jgi:hypothetical protein
MENTELKLVEQSGVELLTQAQIAERHGRSVQWVSEKIKQLGLKPVTEGVNGTDVAAKYDYKQFTLELHNSKVKTTVVDSKVEPVTVNQIAEKQHVSVSTVKRWIQDNNIQPLTEANTRAGVPATYDYQSIIETVAVLKMERLETLLKDEGTVSDVCQYVVSEMRQDKSKEGTEAILANALGFMQMMTERIRELQEQADENVTLRGEVDKLTRQLDISTSVCTVETYAINHGYKVSRHQAGMITRALHDLGYVDDGKVPSKYDNCLPATVWKVEILDYIFNSEGIHKIIGG